MSPAPGQRLGSYEITGKLGEGGMGEVYRATDPALKREVAIKVLPAAFASDPERLARFEREAQVLAQLTHPNIAAIYGLHETDGVRFLAMEMVPGETLEERIARGPVPQDDAVAIAKKLADGLEYAHERGIVHRDLKPANIKLTEDGEVKILDFGLAKAITGDLQSAAPTSTPTIVPTMTSAGTAIGIILGTAAYMSPEQARGRPVDKRADIWAFGGVLYELLTGKRLFDGETISDTIAAVLTRPLDLQGLPSARRSHCGVCSRAVSSAIRACAFAISARRASHWRPLTSRPRWPRCPPAVAAASSGRSPFPSSSSRPGSSHGCSAGRRRRRGPTRRATLSRSRKA